MNRVWLVIFAVAAVFVASCARDRGQDGDRVALTLQFSEQSASRVDALIKDDAAGVFARVEGGGTYVFANHRFVSDDLGKLVGSPVVYFPDATQAVALCAYLPYVAGQNDPSQVSYTTPVDQTSAAQCRQADFLWGRTASTPVAAAVPIHFEHLLSRLVVSTDPVEPITRWAAHNVLIDGKLNVETGVFTIGSTKSHLNTAGRNELILAPQSIQTLDLTVGGVDYTFESPLPIELGAGMSYALQLKLNTTSRTASLAEPVQVVDWTIEQGAGQVGGTANNRFTAYWVLPSVNYQHANKAILHVTPQGQTKPIDVEATAFTRVSVDNDGLCTYTFELQNTTLAYPYKINGVRFFDGNDKLIQWCSSILGTNVYKSGDYTLGIQGGNVLSLLPGKINSFDAVLGSGVISGGVVNGFVFQLLGPLAAGYDYKEVKQIRLTADGVAYVFSTIDFTANSNALVAITDAVFFAGNACPAGYPYTVELVELLDGNGDALVGNVLGNQSGVFVSEWVVSRNGVITMQLFRGQATGLVSQTDFVAYGTQARTDAPIFTGTVVSSPIELAFALGDGVPVAGREATAVARAVLSVSTSDGKNHTVTVSPYTMKGTPLAAWSNAINVVSGAGWPAGARFPYRITGVSLLDKEGNEVVPLTNLTPALEVCWNSGATLSVMKYN